MNEYHFGERARYALCFLFYSISAWLSPIEDIRSEIATLRREFEKLHPELPLRN